MKCPFEYGENTVYNLSISRPRAASCVILDRTRVKAHRLMLSSRETGSNMTKKLLLDLFFNTQHDGGRGAGELQLSPSPCVQDLAA